MSLNFSKLENKKEDLIIYPYKEKFKKNKILEAAFFDRDGVIIEDCHYIKNPKDVRLCSGAKELIRNLFNKNILVIIITNQSGISKGLLSWDDYHRVNNKMIELLDMPNPIKAIYANSYINDKPVNWRKPNPTMILKALNEFNLSNKKSILIGDRNSDIVAGIRANIPKIFHVSTGHGMKEREFIKKFLAQYRTETLSCRNRIKLIDDLKDLPLDIFNY